MTNMTSAGSSSRRTILKAGLVGSAFAISAPYLVGRANAQAKKLRLSHHLAPGHLVDVASKRFAELVAQQTSGQIAVEVFPAAQVAGLRQGAEGLQIGTLDFAWIDFGTLANWRKPLGFVSLPFLFRDTEHTLKVLNGPVGADLRKDVRKAMNIEMLGYGIAGFRVILTKNREVRKPDDLKGVKIRVPEVPVFVSTFRKLGANPTPMAWGEVYTAIQTGVIDAVENPSEGLISGRIQEVAKNASKTFHIMTDVNLGMSGPVLEGLSEDLRNKVLAAGKQATDEYNKASIAADSEFWTKLAGATTAVETPDREAFRTALAPVWTELDQQAGGQMKPWIDRVVATA